METGEAMIKFRASFSDIGICALHVVGILTPTGSKCAESRKDVAIEF